MYRALFISIVLHLVILMSPEPLRPGGGGFSSGSVRVSRAVLRMAGASPAETVGGAGKMAADKKLSSDKRRTSVLPVGSPEHSVLPLFSPSTVANPASHTSVDQSRLLGDALETASTCGEGEREYRLSVAREARKFKAYPSVARTQAWEGVVLIAVSMSLGSPWPDISLQRSSGYDEIDRQTLDMMEQAVKMAAIPPGLQGRRFRMVVPVEYRLTD